MPDEAPLAKVCEFHSPPCTKLAVRTVTFHYGAEEDNNMQVCQEHADQFQEWLEGLWKSSHQ